MRTVQISEKTYHIGALPARRAYDVARKLGSSLMYLNTLRARAGGVALTSARDMGKLLCSGTGYLTYEDNDFVTAACLSVIKRELTVGMPPAPVFIDGQIVYQDIGVGDIAEMIWLVVEESKINDFYAAPPATSVATQEG